jgi:hypothetical protein
MRFFKAKARKEADVPEKHAPEETDTATTLRETKTGASDTDTHINTPGETSKPSSEKESTLVDGPSRNSTPHDELEKDRPTTISPSSSSVPNLELNDPTKESVTKVVSTTESPQEEKREGDNAETPGDEVVYPTGWKLLLITIGLCLCVFCVALVCPRIDNDPINRH